MGLQSDNVHIIIIARNHVDVICIVLVVFMRVLYFIHANLSLCRFYWHHVGRAMWGSWVILGTM